MPVLSTQAHETLFTAARTHQGWTDEAIPEATLHQLYDLMKWGPTEANTTPGRFVFVTSPEAKAKLSPCMAAGNRAKTDAAPVTVLFAYDAAFFEFSPRLMPAIKGLRELYAGNATLAESVARRSASLQAAYFMLAARSLGLDCGPMAGFDIDKVNEAFFAGTTWRINFVCNLGHGDPSKLYPRGPRLDFTEACKIL
ncbi:MAG: malonic semialdehyde reductase [Myxococcales bacterium]|nr:malonic semialdehyde reductase [Myxococcales bacterium]